MEPRSVVMPQAVPITTLFVTFSGSLRDDLI